MARITRSSITQWTQKLLGLQAGIDLIPEYLTSQVVPVVDIVPKHTTIVKTTIRTTTGEPSLYSSPVDKDFFLTFASLQIKKDATCDCTATSFDIVINGETIKLISIPIVTLEANEKLVSLTFPHPIKVDRNQGFTLRGTFTAGTMTRTATFGGFILE